jgi:hypothetical protein
MEPRIEPRTTSRLQSFALLSGVGFTVLTAVGYLLMGKNPEPDASVSAITNYWRSHHAHAQTAGILLAYGTVFFALFGVAIWSRIRSSSTNPFVAGAALIGTAVATVGLFASAMIYFSLGALANKGTTLDATTQTLHALGSELSFPVAGGVELLLLSVALAGIAGRTFPRWVAWSALVIGIMQLTTLGFTAFLVFLLWSLVAGLALTARAQKRTSLNDSATEATATD